MSLCFSALAGTLIAQPLQQKPSYTLDDSLRGTLNNDRKWWNVIRYDISVTPDFNSKSLKGTNEIEFLLNDESLHNKMQIDLQAPMNIDSIIYLGKAVRFNKLGTNSWMIQLPESKTNKPLAKGASKKSYKILIHFSGQPRIAKNPPWDGGWIFTKDKQGRPWMTVACQGLGASVWYPCKDHQSDEPDKGATISITVPDSLTAVANGRLVKKTSLSNGQTTFQWKVVNPINNYNIVPYIGKYVHWSDTYPSITGKTLSLDYWVLDYNQEKAKPQFDRDTRRMLQAFEYWFGPYPFPEDGYKLVESPHLGMEHQSAIAYGNGFANGYRGRDFSGSGWGKDWDFIIVHESGHEWFANSITSNDIADMWIHEGFTKYAEVLFVEQYYGRKAADEYSLATRKSIRNDQPVIGDYGVNQEGSGDMYNKGSGLLHHIREMIGNDSLFRAILRGLNKDYYHRTVDSKDIEKYFSDKSKIDLAPVFAQYLLTTKIPVLEYNLNGAHLRCRFTNCRDDFKMPVRFDKAGKTVFPIDNQWSDHELPPGLGLTELSINYYWLLKEIKEESKN